MAYGGYQRGEPEMRNQMRLQGNQDFALGLGALGLNTAGTAMQGFGAYQAYLQAEQQRKEEERRYEEQMQIAEEERRKRDEMNRQNQIAGFGQYAQNMDQGRRQAYGGFAARVGL